jgi:hypothetical protein
MNKKMKKFLPSKKFMFLLGSFLILALVFFVAFKLFSGKNSFFASKNGKLGVDRLAIAGLTVNELVQKDSDSDGIADWEETLWGTDKNNAMTFDGITDKAYIANKKKELNIGETKDAEGLTETEKFAREFFAAYVAMKTNGTVDPNTINNFGSALGQKIVTPDLVDKFTTKDIKTNEDNTKEGKTKYYQSVKSLFESYKAKGIGDELSVINNQLTSPAGTENPDKLTPIGEAYQEFATKVVKIIVPSSLSAEHLKITNSANNTGISILGMTKITGDPIVGLSGISQYQKYSDELISAVGDLKTKL